MGNQAPQGGVDGNAGTTTTPGWDLFSSPAPPQPQNGEPVTLHVYSFPSDDNKYLSVIEKCGLGAYHSGIEFHGFEVAFDGGFDNECGLYIQRPKSVPKGAEWVYKESVVLGYSTKTIEEYKALLNQLKPKWPHNAYHLLTNNCNHFTSTLSLALLGTDIPRWVNRLAALGATVGSLRSGGIPTQEEIMNMNFLSDDSPANLTSWIDRYQTQAINDDFLYPIQDLLNKTPGAFFKSKNSQETFIFFTFTKKCDVTKIVIGGNGENTKDCNGNPLKVSPPKTIRIFANSREYLNVGQVNKGNPDLEYTMPIPRAGTGSVKGEIVIPSNNVKFQGISYLGIHVKDNFSGSGETVVGLLEVIGVPRG